MSDIEQNDKTGKLPSMQDVTDAIQTVNAQLVNVSGLMKLPPELAVQMPNILRCLKAHGEILLFLKEKEK